MEYKKTQPLRLSFIICILLAATLTARAQDGSLNFSGTRISAGKMMSEIESQTRYKFGFERAAFDTTRMVTLREQSATLEDALSQLTAPKALYMIHGSVIIISPKPEIPARTNDRYTPTDLDALAGAWSQRPAKPEPEPEVITDPIPARVYPEAYSAYNDPDIYKGIESKLPLLAVKTNLLYGAVALTPNLSGEIGLSKNITLEIGGSWNRFHRIGTLTDNKKLNHWIMGGEVRYWMCERFNGHFFGLHGMYSEYNISGKNVPLLFDKKYRYEGSGFGVGLSYGYSLPIAKRWNVEFNVGVGAVRLDYKKHDCVLCSNEIVKETKWKFAPTRAAISLVFLIK